MWIYSVKNTTVTDYYISTLLLAYGHELDVKRGKGIFSFLFLNRTNKVLVFHSYHFFILRILGFKNIDIWIQGDWPEESYNRNKSLLRYALLKYFEFYSVQKCSKLFLVSNGLLSHYSAIFGHQLREKCYVMPCFNIEKIEERCNKIPHSFVYAGSINEYQCFHEVIEFFKGYKSVFEKAELYIFTRDIDRARNVLNEYNVEPIELCSLTVEELADKLKFIKYGFLLRKNLILNWHATPTKLGSYLSNNIIPIISNSLLEYKLMFSDFSALMFWTNYPDTSLESGVFQLLNGMGEQSQEELTKVFFQFYDRSRHVDAIREKFNI